MLLELAGGTAAAQQGLSDEEWKRHLFQPAPSSISSGTVRQSMSHSSRRQASARGCLGR